MVNVFFSFPSKVVTGVPGSRGGRVNRAYIHPEWTLHFLCSHLFAVDRGVFALASPIATFTPPVSFLSCSFRLAFPSPAGQPSGAEIILVLTSWPTVVCVFFGIHVCRFCELAILSESSVGITKQ